MLERDPKKRVTAIEALKHQFFSSKIVVEEEMPLAEVKSLNRKQPKVRPRKRTADSNKIQNPDFKNLVERYKEEEALDCSEENK